jgi:orotate phosphoribosyltransferase
MFAADKQAEKDRLISQLNSCGAVVHGHFAFNELTRDEMHGALYINPRAIFRNYADSISMVQALKDSIPQHVRDSVEVIAGPATGGAILARDLSMLLSNDRPLTSSPLSTMFFTKGPDGDYELTPSDSEFVDGKTVMVVDDIRHIGKTIALCALQVMSAGGVVLATASVVDRCHPHPFKVHSRDGSGVDIHYSAVSIPHDHLYSRFDCPMCKARKPITRF